MFEFKVSIEIHEDVKQYYSAEYLQQMLETAITEDIGYAADVVYVHVDIVEGDIR